MSVPQTEVFDVPFTETACVTPKEDQGLSDVAVDDEEMTEVPEGTAQVCSTRNKWTLHQDLTTLASELLQNKVNIYIMTYVGICVYTCTCTYSTHTYSTHVTMKLQYTCMYIHVCIV